MEDELEEPLGGTAPMLNLNDPEIAGRWSAAEIPCQKIRHALALGLTELAMQRAREATHLMRMHGAGTTLSDTPVAQVEGVSQRTLNALEEELDVVTLGDLLQHNRQTLSALPNFGDRVITDLLLVFLKHTINATRAAEARIAELEARG